MTADQGEALTQSAPASQERTRPFRAFGAMELGVVFQPIVSIATGRQFAVEALARCNRAGLEDPAVLFHNAVQDGTVGRLGRAVREVAFSRCRGVPLFVNLHPAELSSRWLVRPDDPLAFHDHDVYLEITESAVFKHFGLCMGVLKEVCSRTGARLVIDDFGAGYSNLSRVADLEPQVVKLDQELIRGLDKSPRRQILVASVVRLCMELGATVVAEGIETVDELAAARDAGAQYAQGYLLARPGWPIPGVKWPAGQWPAER